MLLLLAPLVSDAGQVGDAAVVAICRRGDATALQAMFDAWGGSARAASAAGLGGGMESGTATRTFVEALERHAVQPAEIDPALRTAIASEKSRRRTGGSHKAPVFAAAAPARDESAGEVWQAATSTCRRIVSTARRSSRPIA